MKEITVSRDISASPEVVWGICTNMDGWVDTIAGIEAVERLDDGQGFGVGTRWRETRTMFGKKATEDIEVSEVDEGERYDTFADSHGAHYETEVRVEPVNGDGSRLTMTFAGEPVSTMAKVASVLMGWLASSATRKALASDLADIGAVAEASA